jgi:hypothetical protein
MSSALARFYTDVLGGEAVLDIRVADIEAVYADWSALCAEFLTPPVDHQREIRCYLRDPDGHLIDVGQTTGM